MGTALCAAVLMPSLFEAKTVGGESVVRVNAPIYTLVLAGFFILEVFKICATAVGESESEKGGELKPHGAAEEQF